MKVELKVVGGTRTGQTIPIAIPQFMIGRADDCHLKPRSELISRYHCAILSENGYIAVRDLGSKNGVYVNGKRVTLGEQELKNGDRLAIGPLEFEVVLTVELKGETKPKITSISDVVSRTVEQNSINVATQRQAQPLGKTPATPASGAPVSAPAADEEDVELADWLLGDDDDSNEETQTLQAAVDSLDLPYSQPESKDPEPEQDKKKSNGEANTSDAAANLLKNFFKGGR